MRTEEHNKRIGAALAARGVGSKPKRCPACGLTKPRSEFGMRLDRRFSRSRCRECEGKSAAAWIAANPERAKAINRRTVLRLNYGITPERYEQLLAGQGGLCAVCRRPPPGKRRLAVDHDHRDGRIRALLCDGCNGAAGLLKDSADIARALAAYLEAWA